MNKPRCVLENPHTALQQTSVIIVCQHLGILLIRDIRRHNAHIHPTAYRFDQRLLHIILNDQIRRCNIKILIRVHDHLIINTFNRIPGIIGRTVRDHLTPGISIHIRHHFIFEIIHMLLVMATCLPHLQEHYRKAPHCISLYPDSGILPDTKSFHKIGIFIRKIKASGITNFSVYDHNLLVRTEIHIQLAGIFHNGVEHPHFKAFMLQNLFKILSGADRSSKIVIHEFDFNTFFNLTLKNFMHFIPQSTLCHNKKVDQNKLFRFL